MANEELIKYMRDYAIKIMSKEIGYKRAVKWINNYNFPISNTDIIKLSNIWHGTVWNVLMDIEKPPKEELEEERNSHNIINTLKYNIFKKYCEKIGPNKINTWLDNYQFPTEYKDLIELSNNWINITKELDSITVDKRVLYKELENYYKNKSILKYIKYKIYGKLL